jgi:hypothetical protein
MNTKSFHAVRIYDEPKHKNWKIPPGIYRAVLENSERDNQGVDILRFLITNYTDADFEYWVRSRYRKEDRKLFNKDMINWLGIAKFKSLTSTGCLVLDSLYGQEADIEVECLQKHHDKDALRVIKSISPPGTLLPEVPLAQ